MKPCSKCKVHKDPYEFWNNKAQSGGKESICISCSKAKNKAYYRNNTEKESKRCADYRHGLGAEERRRSAERYARHAPARRENSRQRSKDRPLKNRAYNAVYRAIQKGELVRPDRCSECPNNGRIYAHHDDYAKQLDVRWLCGSCHQAAHRAGKGEGTSGGPHPLGSQACTAGSVPSPDPQPAEQDEDVTRRTIDRAARGMLVDDHSEAAYAVAVDIVTKDIARIRQEAQADFAEKLKQRLWDKGYDHAAAITAVLASGTQEDV